MSLEWYTYLMFIIVFNLSIILLIKHITIFFIVCNDILQSISLFFEDFDAELFLLILSSR